MSHRNLPLAVLLVALLVGFPGQSFATSMGTDAISSPGSGSKSSKKNDEKLKEVLEEIFTLGGVFSSGGGGSRNSRDAAAETDGSSSSNEWAEYMMGDVVRPPIISPNDPMRGDSGLATPVPEPTGALLFGMGILAVSTGRALSKRRG